jgi:glycine/D-amino acid oxidase-like deaminating enzyme/nitrite reductase/ring-hydroxylating ferredoxin subunit
MSEIQIECVFSKPESKTHYPKLEKNVAVTTDVLVIGAGFTGLTAALQLSNAGKEVIVVDKNEVAGGESGYSTAQLTEFLDTRYQQLIGDFGIEQARLAAASSRAAMEWIARAIQDRKIECEFARVPGYLYCDTDKDVEHIIREVDAAVKCGLHAKRVDSLDPAFHAKCAMMLPDQMQLHPRLYLQGLAKHLADRNVKIFENTHVTDIQDGKTCTVKTADNSAIVARDVVVATHSPICNLVFLLTKIAAYRTYVLGVKLKGTPPSPALYYDTHDPYHYFRPVTFKDEQLWIIGGEDHKTGTVDHTERPYQRLEKYARERFDVAAVPYRWSGQVMESIDGLPFIGKNSASDHLYVGTGYAGNGTTFGTLAGLIISDLIIGKPNPWADVYKATRIKPIAGASDFVSENTDVVIHMVEDYFGKKDVGAPREIPTDSGAILEMNGKKVAMYRDEDGDFHAFSAICPHLGCVVHWNSTEKSWDCPCHGSRFKCTGEVVHGPALSNLNKADVKVPVGV